MLRKLNFTLLALNILFLLIFGGTQLYVHKADIANSSFVKEIGAVQ